MRKALLFLSVLTVLALGLVVISPSDSVAENNPPAASPEVVGSETSPEMAEDALFTPVTKGGGKPSDDCCDPALEPGTNGNPICFEGHTCCPGGWRCNNPDGTPACDKPGEVCPDGCASVGEACEVDSDCCFNKCKGGRCR